MKSNNSDKFEGSGSNKSQTENFFLSEGNLSALNYNYNISEPTKRLNDYDSNILESDAYKDVEDELLKIECKISKIETELKNLEIEITAAVEIKDFELLEELNKQKYVLKNEHKNTINIYKEKSLSGKISSSFSNLFKIKNTNKLKKLHSIFVELKNIILSRMPRNITTIIELRNSLAKLETLNKSVDTLVSQNSPYRDNFNKYEQLSKYIIKANSIQAELSKSIKK